MTIVAQEPTMSEPTRTYIAVVAAAEYFLDDAHVLATELHGKCGIRNVVVYNTIEDLNADVADGALRLDGDGFKIRSKG